MFDTQYALLFRDSVATGNRTMTLLRFQNEENKEGKGDSNEINLDDDEPFL